MNLSRDDLVDMVLSLSLKGESAPAIAKRLLITPAEARRIIKRELAISPGTIGSMQRPSRQGKPPAWKIERMAELYQAGMADHQIAAEIEMTLPVVRYYLRRETDYQPPRQRRWTFEEDKYLIEHAADMDTREIARNLGRPLPATRLRYHKLREQGIPVYKTRGRRYDGNA